MTFSQNIIVLFSFTVSLKPAQHRSTQHRHGTCEPVSQLSASRHLQVHYCLPAEQIYMYIRGYVRQYAMASGILWFYWDVIVQ